MQPQRPLPEAASRHGANARYPSTSAFTRLLTDGPHTPECTHTRMHSSLMPPTTNGTTFLGMVEAAALLFDERWLGGRGHGCRRVHTKWGGGWPRLRHHQCTPIKRSLEIPHPSEVTEYEHVGLVLLVRKAQHISTARQSFSRTSAMARHLCSLTRIESSGNKELRTTLPWASAGFAARYVQAFPCGKF